MRALKPWSTTRLASVLLLALMTGLAGGADTLETFRSHSHGFSVRYPATWYPLILSDVFYIESFPPSKAVRGARLPQGGAGIKVLVPSQTVADEQKLPVNLEDWVALSLNRRHIISRRSLEVRDGAHALAITEVRTACCAVPPIEESTDWYFEVGGRMFVGTVFYWQGDPKADTWRETLKDVVLSLRAIHP